MASVSTPVNQKGEERDNFYRFNSLIVDNAKDAFINILELHLTKKNLSFEQFINLNQHEIYHLCFNKLCCKGSCTLPGKRILQVPQLELLFDKNGSTFPGHRGTREFCCCKAKPNIQTDVLDITLAYCLLINFCFDVFWYCCLDVNQPSVTLEDFLNIHKHDLYHLKIGPRPCCQCPPGYISTVTHAPLYTSDWTFLFSGSRSGQPCNLPLHVYDSCCSVTATPGITTSRLNNHLTTTLHKHFCKARKHLEMLRNYRNGLFAHLKEGALSDHEYQSAASDIKKAVLHIGKVCNKEKEAKDALDDLERRPLGHCSFLQDLYYTLKQAINFDELKESLGGIVTERVNEIVYHQSETQTYLTALRDELIRITEEEDMSDNARAVINGMLVKQPGNTTTMCTATDLKITPTRTATDIKTTPTHTATDLKTTPTRTATDLKTTPTRTATDSKTTPMRTATDLKTTPTRTTTDLKDLIEVILNDLSHEDIGYQIPNFYEEVRKNIDNSGMFKPSDQSIEETMIRHLPDRMPNKQRKEYSEAISDLTKTLRYLNVVGISVLSENDLISILKKGDRNKVMKKLLKKITTLMQYYRRRNFGKCMQYMSAYRNLCILWDIVILYLSFIFSINSGHSNKIANAEMDSIHQQRHEDKKLFQCYVQPQEKNVIFALLYTSNQWLPVQAFLDSRNMESESLEHLCSGQFTITPFKYRSSTVYISATGSCLRWSYSNKKFTNFTFRNKTEGGKTYFYIFSADYPNHYVKMGMFSWYITCQKGDPEGCNDGTWIIERLEDNTDECYVLCTKDSNGNCLTAGSFRKRLRGKRGAINKRRMWLICKSNSFTDDSNSQLMQTM